MEGLLTMHLGILCMLQTCSKAYISLHSACNVRIHLVIGERERANLVVQLARFFYIYIYSPLLGGCYVYNGTINLP